MFNNGSSLALEARCLKSQNEPHRHQGLPANADLFMAEATVENTSAFAGYTQGIIKEDISPIPRCFAVNYIIKVL